MNSAEHNGRADAKTLRWPGKLLSADDLRRHLKGHSELIVQRHAIVTPLAVDELKDRKVRLVRADFGAAEKDAAGKAATSCLAYAQDRPFAMVAAAVKSLEREGLPLRALEDMDGSSTAWARMLAAAAVNGKCVAFCGDPGLVCCVANKTSGVRAAAVMTVIQAARAIAALGANLLAVEMPGRTLFEIRQILATLHRATTRCPTEIAETLRELDGHAHR